MVVLVMVLGVLVMVVVTSNLRDAVMLGGRSGRGTRRERKLPQR